MRSYSRRGFLRLAAATTGVAALATLGRAPVPSIHTPAPALDEDHDWSAAGLLRSVPSPAVGPRRTELIMMEGTRYATGVVVHESGRPGPTVMVLGGVHGNEPAGWGAAEDIAEWEVQRGTLIVAPRINHIAAEDFRRTFDDFGDLNRLYPGDPESKLPMERMAYEIVALARVYSTEYLFDLHESWGFYQERAPGYSSVSSQLGQLVVAGGDEEATALIAAVLDEVNGQVIDRELFTIRDRRHPDWSWIGLGRSSISLGAHIQGCTPVLVETGQNDQPKERRIELNRALLGTMLCHLGMTPQPLAAMGPHPNAVEAEDPLADEALVTDLG